VDHTGISTARRGTDRSFPLDDDHLSPGAGENAADGEPHHARTDDYGMCVHARRALANFRSIGAASVFNGAQRALEGIVA
jgi:hypothetical protein